MAANHNKERTPIFFSMTFFLKNRSILFLGHWLKVNLVSILDWISSIYRFIVWTPLSRGYTVVHSSFMAFSRSMRYRCSPFYAIRTELLCSLLLSTHFLFTVPCCCSMPHSSFIHLFSILVLVFFHFSLYVSSDFHPSSVYLFMSHPSAFTIFLTLIYHMFCSFIANLRDCSIY